MARFAVAFDASPLNEPTAWMKLVCSQANLFLVDLDKVADLIAEDDEGRAAMLKANEKGSFEGLGAHYLKALEKLAAGQTRIAVHSLTWLKYGLPVDAVIVSYDQIAQTLRAQLAKLKPSPKNEEMYEVELKRMSGILDGAVATVPAAKLLKVAGSDAEKAAAAVKFITQR